MYFERTMEDSLIDRISHAARSAGGIMLSAADIERKTSEKEGHGNFVTEYDKKVQEYLYGALKECLPEARFLGEEEGKDVFKEEYRKGLLFVVDPIDGTANFMSGCRPSVISIALFKNGAPWIGVVYNPYENEMYTAEKGCGAFLNGTGIMSSERDLAHSLVIFGTSPYYPELEELTFALARKYMHLGIDIRHLGTSAWDLCCLARGAAGIFYELRLSLWDYAAAALIAEEAGCRVTDAAGRPLRFDGKTSVLAASRGVAAEGGYLPEDVLQLRK